MAEQMDVSVRKALRKFVPDAAFLEKHHVQYIAQVFAGSMLFDPVICSVSTLLLPEEFYRNV